MAQCARQLCWAGGVALVFFTQSSLAATWHDEMPGAKVLGSGEFSWFGLAIYNAKLWSEHQPFDANARFALELTYHRSLSGRRISQTSINEIKRLFGQQYSAVQLDMWLSVLNKSIPDVSDGSQLIGVYEPAQGMRLYDGSKLIADIHDPVLAHAFFAIWLDERSKDRALRAQLLGTPP
jgi:hypothetical protein